MDLRKWRYVQTTMIINPIYIYLINVCNTLQILFGIIGVLYASSGLILWLSTIDMYDDDIITEYKKKAKQLLIPGIILIMIAILLPDKETSYTMLIASQVTTTNIEAATSAAKDIIDYIAKVLK